MDLTRAEEEEELSWPDDVTAWLAEHGYRKPGGRTVWVTTGRQESDDWPYRQVEVNYGTMCAVTDALTEWADPSE